MGKLQKHKAIGRFREKRKASFLPFAFRASSFA